MKRFKLTKCINQELKASEMKQIRGGGCTSKCGANVSLNADQAIKDVKNHIAQNMV